MNVSLFDIRISLAFDHELLYNKFKAGINKNEVISCGVYVLFVAWHNHPSRGCRGNCAGAHIHLVRARGPLSPHCQPGWRPPLASDSAVTGTVAALFVTRPLAKRLQKPEPASTNADRVIGAAAVVTQEINNLQATGRVSVMGNSWAARSQQEKRIPTGETVKIVRIEGVKLIVAPNTRGEPDK